MQIVADLVGIHAVEVYSVATFYAFLHGAPEGRFVVRLCGTLSCDFAGKTAVAEALRGALGIDFGATTDDGVFTLEWASCVGMCDQGPALLVNDKVFTRVTPEKVAEIVAEYRGKAVDEARQDIVTAAQRAHLREHRGRRRPQGRARALARRHRRHRVGRRPQGPRRRRLSDRHEVELLRGREERPQVHHLQRRRRRARHLQGPRHPARLRRPRLRGHDDRRPRHRRRPWASSTCGPNTPTCAPT